MAVVARHHLTEVGTHLPDEVLVAALVARGFVPAGTTLRAAVEAGRFAWIVNEDARDQGEPLGSFEHPGAFDAVMDAMWWLTPTEWSRLWRNPAFPLPDALRRSFQRHGTAAPARRDVT